MRLVSQSGALRRRGVVQRERHRAEEPRRAVPALLRGAGGGARAAAGRALRARRHRLRRQVLPPTPHTHCLPPNLHLPSAPLLPKK